MRRVVVTGMGIVSSIGNNTQEVLASLREAKSGIVRAEKYAELGFRCQVHGEPQLDWEPQVPRKPRRFMEATASAGTTSPWIRPSATPGSRKKTSSTSAPASSWARAAPRRAPSSRAADIDAREGPQEGRPVRGAEGACARALRRARHRFQIKGVNYSISSACATSAHCIGNAAELIQWGKQDVMFAGGCEELDWTLSVLFDAMGAMSTSSTPRRPRRAAPTTRTATASSSPAARAWWCWRSWSTPRRAAPRSTARSSATAPPRTASTWWRRRAKAPCAACSWP